MTDNGFNFKKFIDDSKKIIINPKEYFSYMPKEGGFADPVTRAVIYGAIAGIFTIIWAIVRMNFARGMAGGMMGGFGVGAGILVLIFSVIGALIGLFICGAIVLVISAISEGNTNYEISVRVAASLMVLFPINALLSFNAGINLLLIWLGTIVSLVLSLYGLYLLYVAVIIALGGKEAPVKIVAIVLAVLNLIIIFNKTYDNHQKMSNLGSDWMKSVPKDLDLDQETKENMEHVHKMMEELKKMK